MGAELRIQGDEVVRAAEELAGLLKMSVSDAVADAVRARLQHERESQVRYERMMELAADIRAHLHTPLSMTDIDDILYGPDGLPA
jgi:hypothetical protein